MHDFKRKTAVMPDLRPSASTATVLSQLDEKKDDLGYRALSSILALSDRLEKTTDWLMSEVVDLSHVQNQLVEASLEHDKEIQGIKSRESTYRTEMRVGGLALFVVWTVGTFLYQVFKN